MSKTMGMIMRPIIEAKTKEEAQGLLAAYEKENPKHGRANVRHMLGYYDDKTIERLKDWLDFTSVGWAASVHLRN